MVAIHLYNRNPTAVLNHSSLPYEALYKQPLDYSKLRVFGSKCFPNLWPYRSNKLQDKSEPCLFMGYPANSDRYICMSSNDGRVIISCES